MADWSKALLTGGSGLLGRHLREVAPDLDAPSSDVVDVTDAGSLERYCEGKTYERVIHAAAFTSPPRINENPALALDVNIVGTANVVRLCLARGWRLVYISTDYVFAGDAGNYAENDPVLPQNKYAWSKLGGECAVRLYENALIIRTSFGEDTFPFPKAFVDQWTSRESVSVIAPKILQAAASDITGVLHVGGPRRTVFDYAKELDPAREIGELRLDEVSFDAPRDTSLNTDRYRTLVEEQSASRIE